MKTLHILATPYGSDGNNVSLDHYYTRIHINMDKVMCIDDYERALMSISSQTYTRSKFKCKMQTKDELEEELRKEAQMINYDKASRGEDYDIQGYVKSRLPALTEQRQYAWQSARELFNKIEDAKEEKANIENAEAYQREYDSMKSLIRGDEPAVESRIHRMVTDVRVPYNIEISYDYAKAAKLMEVELLLEDGVNIPTWKTSVTNRGKTSIKDKLAREVQRDQTDSTISLLFFISSKIFSVSPNIQVLQMTMFDRVRTAPILWVEFERGKFSKISPQTVNILSEIYAYPHIFDLRLKRDALELVRFPISKFENERKQYLTNAERPNVQQKSNFKDVGIGQIAISYDMAQQLSTIPHISENIQEAIFMARENGWEEVIIDEKHRGLVKELANNNKSESSTSNKNIQ